MKWSCKKFSYLSVEELYDILKLRIEVFVVEQNCVFQDCDGLDPDAWHVMGYQENELVAYSRLLAPGVAYTQMSIGRVVNSATVRHTGVGRTLMTESIRKCRELFGAGPIKIGAQLYLNEFYYSFGFENSGPEYIEDGIPHIHMILK